MAAKTPHAYNSFTVIMNAKFEWFGFSVARKHIYFYLVLIATSLCVNNLKDSLLGAAVFENAATEQLDQWRDQMSEGEDSLALSR